MVKPFFEPIDIGGDVIFYDWRNPATHPAPREQCVAVLHKEFEAQVAEVAESSVSAPGCHRMWNGSDTEDFKKQLSEPGAFKHLSAYRKSLRQQRLEDGLDGTSRTLLAWRGTQPLGGVVLYNDKILSVWGDIIMFVSHIGPFTVQAELTADLMDHLLENRLHGMGSNGEPVIAQLTEWQFPWMQQNRWRDDLPTFIKWKDLLHKHTSTHATDNGVEYRVAYRLVSPVDGSTS